MFNLSKIVIWMCKRFNRDQIKQIIGELDKIIKDPNSDPQPKDTFKEDNPNYRKFEVDPNPPLKKTSKKKRKKTTRKS